MKFSIINISLVIFILYGTSSHVALANNNAAVIIPKILDYEKDENFINPLSLNGKYSVLTPWKGLVFKETNGRVEGIGDHKGLQVTLTGEWIGDHISGYWVKNKGAKICNEEYKGSFNWGRFTFKFDGEVFEGKTEECHKDPLVSGNMFWGAKQSASIPGGKELKTAGAYMYGKIKDMHEAEKWFLKSANLGYAPAMWRLTQHFRRTKEDHVSLIRKAVGLGSYLAMEELAVMYAEGRLVPKNDNLARTWAQRAASKNYHAGRRATEGITYQNKKRADQRAAAQKQSIELAKKEEAEALMQAEVEYKKEQKKLKQEKRWVEQRQVQANQDAGLRDLINKIQNTGDDIANTMHQSNRDTARAFNKDQHTQRRNEEKSKAEYEKKKQAILANSNQKNAAASQYADKNTAATQPVKWDCDRQWRADKCDDRHTVHNINSLPRTYTGNGFNTVSSSGAVSSEDAQNSNETQGGSQGNPVSDATMSDENKATVKKKKERERIDNGQVVGKSGRSNYSRKSALKEAQADLEGKASKFCKSKIYRVEISWLDHATKCDDVRGKFKCEVHANAFCYSTSCNKLYCDTARSR
jgi:hypothetical protein